MLSKESFEKTQQLRIDTLRFAFGPSSSLRSFLVNNCSQTNFSLNTYYSNYDQLVLLENFLFSCYITFVGQNRFYILCLGIINSIPLLEIFTEL